MRDEQILQNATSVIKNFKLRSSTTGQLLTGKVATDFSGTRHVAGGTTTALAFSSGTAGDAYSSGKICPLTNGTYDWHIPNAMFSALGQSNAVISCTGAIDVVFDLQVIAADRGVAAFGANVTAPATPTNVSDVQTAVLAKLPAALVGGRIDASVGAMASNVITAAAINAAALNGKGDWNTVAPSNLTAAQIAAGVWQDTTAGDFTVALSVGKSVMNGVALGTGLTVLNVTNAPISGDLTAAMKASVTAAVPTAAQVAVAVEAAILNEGDATALLAAIAAKIETFLINDGDATATLAAIATAVRTNLSTELGRIDATISSRNATTPPTVAAIRAELDSNSTQLAAIKADTTTLTGRITATIETMWAALVEMISGVTPNRQFTAKALELGPAGGGGGGTGDASQATLLQVKAQVIANGAALSGTPIQPVSRIVQGAIRSVYIGENWLQSRGTSQNISVSDTSGALYTKLVAIGVSNLQCGASRLSLQPGIITFTVVALHQTTVSGQQVCQIELEGSNLGSGLQPSDDYQYQIRQLVGADPFVEIEGPLSLRPRRV